MVVIPENVETFGDDGRESFNELYEVYFRLVSEFDFLAEEIYWQEVELLNGKKVNLPVVAFRTETESKAVWLIVGNSRRGTGGAKCNCQAN